MLINDLDRIANRIEAQGLLREAYTIDLIANTAEANYYNKAWKYLDAKIKEHKILAETPAINKNLKAITVVTQSPAEAQKLKHLIGKDNLYCDVKGNMVELWVTETMREYIDGERSTYYKDDWDPVKGYHSC